MLRLVIVKSKRSISVLLLSYPLLVATGVLHPTPLDHIAYVTLFFAFGALGREKSLKNSKSIRVSINSSASGLTSSNSSPAASSFASSSCDSSNNTFRASDACLDHCQLKQIFVSCHKGPYRVRFLLVPQKNLSSHGCSWSASYRYGSIRVRTLMQFRASLSGAISGSGKDGLLS